LSPSFQDFPAHSFALLLPPCPTPIPIPTTLFIIFLNLFINVDISQLIPTAFCSHSFSPLPSVLSSSPPKYYDKFPPFRPHQYTSHLLFYIIFCFTLSQNSAAVYHVKPHTA